VTRLIAVSLIAMAGLAAVPAHAQRAQVRPHIDAGQVLTADIQGGDVLTYSTVGAGVDVSVHSRRVEVTLSYNYQHRFSYDSATPDDDLHSGIAVIRARVMPAVTIEAGGIAARGSSDIRGARPGDVSLSGTNRSQIYSGYIGPSLSTHVGPMFVNGAYRFGYTKVESPGGGTGVPAGQPPLDVYDDSTVHVATASVGVRSGTVLPIGVTVSGSYTRENAGQLDNRFEGKYGRGDVVLPIGRGFAIAGGVGYEQIRITQRDALVVGGVVQRDAAGRFITDPASAPRIAYDTDGLFWDAGVIWRPSRRTFLEARVGKRYGSWTYTGSLSYQMGPGSGIQIGVYDNVTSFGQQANGGVAALPTSFDTDSGSGFNQSNTGCVFGNSGGAAGSCMNGIFASAATGNYRSRGATGVIVLNRGPNHFGFGGGYARRDFIAPPALPGGITVNGTSDQTYYAQVFASRGLGRNAAISGNAFVSYYSTDLPGSDPTMGWGANTAYTQRFFGHLDATAAVGVYGYEAQGTDNNITAQAVLGLRYGF
jgi:hypothetical protein